MKHQAHKLLPILLFCLLLAGVSRAASQEVKITKSGETALRAVLGGKTVQITLHTARLKKSDAGFPLALDYYDEVSIVQVMRIVVDGKTVWVPWSAYADLFNPTVAHLRFEKGVFKLLIGGADGADLYRVLIHFNSDRVTRRESYDSFSHKAGEVILYSPKIVIE